MSIAIWEYNPKCPSGHFFLLYFPSIYKLWKSYIKYNINKMCATLGIINRYSPILDWMEYKKNKNDKNNCINYSCYAKINKEDRKLNEDLLNIEIIREYIVKRKIDWTKHCLNRLHQRNILISDVKTAINNGKIIEYYYDDYPYPSCLILGYNTNNKTIHIVCGVSEDTVHMITAYYPNTDKWEENMKTRRKK